MSSDELREFVKVSGLNLNEANKDLTKQATIASVIYIFRAGGFQSYKLTVIIANMIVRAITGTGLRFASNAALVKVMSILAGPVGWIATGAWTAYDIAGPAYRVTVPFVIEVVLLRNLYKANQIDSEWSQSIFNE